MPDTKTDLIDRAQAIIATLRNECTDCGERLTCENGKTLCGFYCPNKDAANLIEAQTEQIVALRAQSEDNPPLTLDELRGMRCV